MERKILHLSTTIAAPKEKVWQVLLQDETYRLWTSVFHPGSYAESNWQEGGKALFKTPEGQGLVSNILEHKPQQVISFEHIGLIADGKEIYDTEEVQQWKGARETYTLSGEDGATVLTIEQDMTPQHYDWFCDVWQQALQKIKELSEKSI